jgi:hypothetical protein
VQELSPKLWPWNLDLKKYENVRKGNYWGKEPVGGRRGEGEVMGGCEYDQSILYACMKIK